jgi:uncharacterized protein
VIGDSAPSVKITNNQSPIINRSITKNMIQFIIEALDGTDSEAINRRMAARPSHLAGAKTLKDSGNYILGGAKVDDAGKMIGSTMVLQFETEEDFNRYYAQEPYVVGRVWDTIKVYKFRVATP